METNSLSHTLVLLMDEGPIDDPVVAFDRVVFCAWNFVVLFEFYEQRNHQYRFDEVLVGVTVV
ncbi:hypothetical protein [Pasteuria penetrans]|uniref:hypothetical protein n=1 Tax=Pasteuria penetrans TaxID=86005 RepID=UPI000F90A844|nr:hypothetical protein [Pasteuria penetrans]